MEGRRNGREGGRDKEREGGKGERREKEKKEGSFLQRLGQGGQDVVHFFWET